MEIDEHQTMYPNQELYSYNMKRPKFDIVCYYSQKFESDVIENIVVIFIESTLVDSDENDINAELDALVKEKPFLSKLFRRK